MKFFYWLVDELPHQSPGIINGREVCVCIYTVQEIGCIIFLEDPKSRGWER